MNRIASPLTHGMTGPEVADLQLALGQLLERGLVAGGDDPLRGRLHEEVSREAASAAYLDGTAKTVAIFQSERRLAAGREGEVDDATAAALNDLLRELGLLDRDDERPERPRLHGVSGTVRSTGAAPARGATARAYHESDRGPIRLGQDTVDAEGHYAIRYEPLPGVDRVDLRVSVATAAGGLVTSSQVVRGAGPLEVIDLSVDPAVDLALSTVHGTVASPSRAASGGLDVRIVDKNAGDDVELARTTTDERGRYEIAFDSSRLRSRGKAKPDLQARVFAGGVLVAESEIRYDAGGGERLDVTLPARSAALATEYDTLVAGLSARFDGSLRDLKEGDGRQDVTYLANKTGWDARAVAMAALADQFSQHRVDGSADGGLAAPLYYALFRAGLPANADALYGTSAGTVERAWKQALETGVIDAAGAGDLAAASAAFTRLSAAHALDSRALEGASTLKEMLTPVLATDAEQRRFAELRAVHRRDRGAFWQEAERAFGPDVTARLRLDGQLGSMTLNNAPLIARLHEAEGREPIGSTVDLARRGYHRADRWHEVTDGEIPAGIPGGDAAERRGNYDALLAAQIRVSFPTLVMAEMVRGGEIALTEVADLREGVHAFLSDHHGDFDIGMQPVEQYVARNDLAGSVDAAVTDQIKRLQRVYQITPDDRAMSTLLSRGIDSAAQVMRYERAEFVAELGDELGGAIAAELTYAKSEQVSSSIVNLVASYVTSRQGTALGSDDAPFIGHGKTEILTAANAGDVIAMPTLESLLGSMDYCECAHCRSVLSPAAYLVDLLEFIDRPSNARENPQTVLLERRPDLQHLPLSCENTNTAMPYIDVVNETLEYFVANGLSLASYAGHDTDGSATAAELLANPRHVDAAAYQLLGQELFPPPLPFDQPLEALRRHVSSFGTTLPEVMELLRPSDALERPGPASYGWRDILMERAGLSRAEYRLLTDRTLSLPALYGFPAGTTTAEAILRLSNAKLFSRRAGISYEEAAALLTTRFVNPHARLIPRLERLGVTFATLRALKAGTITDADFRALLPAGLDQAAYGGDVVAWVKDPTTHDAIMSIIVLVDTGAGADPCSFDDYELRHAHPDPAASRLQGIDLVRMLRFIRLWRALGWTIEQTDQLIAALYPAASLPAGVDEAADLLALDTGFLVMLPRIGVALEVIDRLKLRVARDLPGLLACWSEIDAHGPRSAYARMFLNPATLQLDPAFADDGFGRYLVDGAQRLLPHGETLRAAFGLTGDELELLVAHLGYDANTPLALAAIGAIHRRSWLARTLKMSVRELLALIDLTGLDPFAAPDPVDPACIRLIGLVDALRAASLKPTEAFHLLWNRDLGGRAAPLDRDVVALAWTLRTAFDAIEADLAIVDDPTGEIARTKMALVYGADATDTFFGLLNGASAASVAYDHTQAELEPAILAVGGARLTYDDLRKQLSYAVVLTPQARDDLKGVAGTPAAFATAVDALFALSEGIVAPLFARYPELRPLHDAFRASSDPVETRRRTLLTTFIPTLIQRRQRQHALDTISAAVDAEPALTAALLHDAAALHASGDVAAPALDDLTAIGAHGLSARYFWRGTATGAVGREEDAVPDLAFRPTGPTRLPGSGAVAGDPISAIWSGYLDAPESGFYGLSVEADAGAVVSLTVAGAVIGLDVAGTVRSNQAPIFLTAGIPTAIEVRVEAVEDMVIVRWATTGLGWEVIPSRYLYSASRVGRFRESYLRLLRSVALAAALRLTAGETAFFAADAGLRIGGQGWLNSLPVAGAASPATAVALGERLATLLSYVAMRSAIAPDDGRLVELLRTPAATLPNGESLLFSLTGWPAATLESLLSRLGMVRGDLGQVAGLRRVFDAFGLIRTMGIPAPALIAVATNVPGASTVAGLQTALRARYAEADWLAVLRPINDDLRAGRRDALVAYVLQQMSEQAATSHIDTADKLFEYFLMDVQMEPCMETSRIRHALSSVQLFVERCMMNLEPRVSPTSIRAGQWAWMRRYRVWEANRKVFLWPENWLEPELRDDQSQPFKEAMGELLQSDITEETAARALVGYLMRLEEIAKLEPCGIHVVERDPGVTDDIVHVVARTAGANRRHFYRRHEGGSWSPWEHVKLDIEDTPVTPVVWRDRLFLFWVRITKEAVIDPSQQTATSDTTGAVSNLSMADVKTDLKKHAVANARLRVGAVLCWSERVDGAWMPAKTSDIERPTILQGSFAPAGQNAFVRADLRIETREVEDGLWVRLYGQGWGAFLLYNTHSLPVRYEDVSWDAGEQLHQPTTHRDVMITGDTLSAAYSNYDTGAWEERDILFSSIGGRVVDPTHDPREAWVAPFLLEDSRHVFYVETTAKPVSIAESTWYGTDPGWVEIDPRIPDLYHEYEVEPEYGPPDFEGPVVLDKGTIVTNPVRIKQLLSVDANIRVGIASRDAFPFAGTTFGITGPAAGPRNGNGF